MNITKWCTEHSTTPYKFALRHGIDPSAISKFLKGRRELSLGIALAVRNATDGEVSLQDLGWTTVEGRIVKQKGASNGV